MKITLFDAAEKITKPLSLDIQFAELARLFVHFGLKIRIMIRRGRKECFKQQHHQSCVQELATPKTFVEVVNTRRFRLLRDVPSWQTSHFNTARNDEPL